MPLTKTYSDVIKLPTFEERFEYLKLNGRVGEDTFGSRRYLNQTLYTSKEWRDFRHKIIVRDNGCDLASEDREIPEAVNIVIHHINPISIEDILERRPNIFDPENVITTTKATHDGIHYGGLNTCASPFIARSPNDTSPWRK